MDTKTQLLHNTKPQTCNARAALQVQEGAAVSNMTQVMQCLVISSAISGSRWGQGGGTVAITWTALLRLPFPLWLNKA